MRALKAIGWMLVEIAAATIGYGLSKSLVPNPDVRGAFLFVSPMLALGVLGLLGPWSWTQFSRPQKKLAQPELEARVARIAGKLGVSTPLVWVSDEELHGDGFALIDGDIFIYPAAWKKLTEPEQDFVIAHRLSPDSKASMRCYWPLSIIAVACGAAIACINLWFILGLHAAGLTGWFWMIFISVRRMTLRQDVEAVKATGDLDGARAYLRKRPHDLPFLTVELRLKNLDRAFGD